MVGPRWRRSARLLEPSDRPPDTPAGPATPPPTSAARTPLHADPEDAATPTQHWPSTIMPEAPTRRLETDDGPERRDGAECLTGDEGRGACGGAAVRAGRRPQRPGLGLPVARTEERRSPRPRPLRAPTSPCGSRAAGRGCKRPPDLGLPLSACGGGRPPGVATARSWCSAWRGAGGVEQRAASGRVPRLDSADRPAQFPARARSACLPRTCRLGDTATCSPVGNHRQLTVYTVPTSGGVATVACALPPAAAAASPRNATRSPERSGSERPRVSGRPERRVRQLPQRDDRRPSAGHQLGAGDACTSSQTLAGQAAAAAGAGQRLRECRRPARRAEPEPSRQERQRASSSTALRARRQRVPPGRAAPPLQATPDAYRAASAAIPAAKRR